MSSQKILVNTLVQPKNIQPFVDFISKIFIISQLLLGVNRIPILTKKYVYIIITAIYSITIIGVIINCTVVGLQISRNFFIILNISVHIFCIISSIFFSKKLNRYYCELNTFDMEVACRPKYTRGSMKNIALMYLLIVYIFIFFVVIGKIKFVEVLLYLIPVHAVHTLEVYYYGHLLNLLTPRLRLINYYMQISLFNDQVTNVSIINEFTFFRNHNKNYNCQMKNIMNFYNTIIKVYNLLIEAIKWQLLVLIITSFINVLGLCYQFSLKVIRGQDVSQSLVSDLGLTIAVTIPLFAPCMFGDEVHSQVLRLRELLASRLYENNLDKSCRRIARAMLALTETRDLSFSLLRILKIDTSLPFKFVGLLVTYLIILLQFEKVINP